MEAKKSKQRIYMGVLSMLRPYKIEGFIRKKRHNLVPVTPADRKKWTPRNKIHQPKINLSTQSDLVEYTNNNNTRYRCGGKSTIQKVILF